MPKIIIGTIVIVPLLSLFGLLVLFDIPQPAASLLGGLVGGITGLNLAFLTFNRK